MIAWVAHCHDMLEVAMRVTRLPTERWLVWDAILCRLTASRATQYLPWDELGDADRFWLVNELIARIDRLRRVDLPGLLGESWEEIRGRSLSLVTAGDPNRARSTAGSVDST
jgi:hypothetical protein